MTSSDNIDASAADAAVNVLRSSRRSSSDDDDDENEYMKPLVLPEKDYSMVYRYMDRTGMSSSSSSNEGNQAARAVAKAAAAAAAAAALLATKDRIDIDRSADI